ncbi:bifunctional RNase H/acid phosphatase, partial [Cryobacterium sp. TMT2-10]
MTAMNPPGGVSAAREAAQAALAAARQAQADAEAALQRVQDAEAAAVPAPSAPDSP